MAKLVFVALALILAIYDYKKLTIPNFIVLPAIVIGVDMTGNWEMAVIMFLFGALLFSKDFIGGGDVKLLAMTGAFLGLKAIFILGLAMLLLNGFRRIKDFKQVLPYAPFVFVSSLFFLW